jgi:polyisoprenoid-binding protein YceI
MLMRCVATIAVVAFLVSPAFAEKLKLNKEQSKIDFVGSKMEDGKKVDHKGGFKEFKVECDANLEAPDQSKLKVEIDTTSMWSDDAKLTDHLKAPDFFDAKKYPKITFEMTGMEGVGSDSPTLIGKLTMLDKTSELRVPCHASLSDSELILEADFKLDRTKWGMNYGKGKINDEVVIKATLHFER